MSDFNRIRGFSEDFHKVSNISINENPSSGSCADLCGETDGRTDLTNSKNSSLVDSRLRRIIKSNISETNSISIIRVMPFHVTVMMGMDLVSEMSDFIVRLTLLSAREDFIDFRRHENLKTDRTELIRASRCWCEQAPQYAKKLSKICCKVHVLLYARTENGCGSLLIGNVEMTGCGSLALNLRTLLTSYFIYETQ